MKDFLKLIRVQSIDEGHLFLLLNKTSRKKILLGITMCILLVVMCVVPASAESSGIQAEVADFTEGGHLETDFDAFFMAEWWYLNGNATLVSSDGEKKGCWVLCCSATSGIAHVQRIIKDNFLLWGLF